MLMMLVAISSACVDADVDSECGPLPWARPPKEPTIVLNTDTLKVLATWREDDWHDNRKWQSVVDDYLECVRSQETSPSSR